MSKIDIRWPSPESLFPQVNEVFVDVHGHLEKSIILTTPVDGVPPANLLISGIHGTAKSLMSATLAVELGERRGRPVPVVTYDCSEDTFELMLTGSSRVVPGGETPFIPGPFPTAIKMANECGLCVFIAEEISALTPGAQKVFNRITDWRRGIYVADVNQYFRLDEGCHVIIVANMNPSGYGGVYTLNQDLYSRFDPIRVPLPNREQEKRILKATCTFASSDIIDKVIQLGTDSRTNATETSLVTRDLVKILNNIERFNRAGLPEDSFPLEMALNKFEGRSDRTTMADKIDAIFSTEFKPLVQAEVV
jgi:hypothetical protein